MLKQPAKESTKLDLWWNEFFIISKFVLIGIPILIIVGIIVLAIIKWAFGSIF